MFVRFSLGMMFLALATLATGCSAPAIHNGLPTAHNLPPAEVLMHPGPGVGGPGPGVLAPIMPMGHQMSPAPTVQVFFNNPGGMEIRWDVDGVGLYDSQPLVGSAHQNFPEGGLYRLKLTNIPGHVDSALYPSLEVAPTSPRSGAYLAHAAIPVQFTAEDFDQALAGNFVTKVIYLPDAEFQELALAGVDTLVSTRLDPGVDPIVEADRRGAILAIIRMGNKDMEMPGSEAGGAIHQASFGMMQPGAPAGSAPMPYNSASTGSNYISGVTAPPYGMAITPTPIGLPGPPHIPLGAPAGLQQHTMHNHPAMHIPGPTPAVNMHVKQAPGLSYPRPADRVFVHEQTIAPQHYNRQPPANMVYGDPNYCPPGQ